LLDERGVTKMNLIYGKRNDEVVHIDNVERGLACDCVCPACGQALVAKKGENNVVAHHFAHYRVGNCKFGYQLYLQNVIRAVLKETKCMKLPAVEYENINFEIETLKEAKTIQIDRVEMQFKLCNIIQDLVVTSGDNQFIIFPFVTYGMTAERIQRAKELNISIVEIDFSNTVRYIDEDEIRDILMGFTFRKKWKYSTYKAYWVQYFEKYICKSYPISRSLIDDCPLIHSSIKGKAFKKHSKDCKKCMYFQDYQHTRAGHKISAVKCSCEKRISSLKELSVNAFFKKDLELKRQEIYEEIIK
jgi:hypothetical protein